MEFSLSRGLAVDLIQKASEFLIPVTCHALPDDPALRHIEHGE
jgi:hypothetical protein